MTECNGCGSCCDPVWLPYTQETAKFLGGMPDDNRRWILEDLTPMSKTQAKLREPELVRQIQKIRSLAKSAGGNIAVYYYSCKNFDTETRQCLIYDNRPTVCRRYPWLTGKPIPGTPLPPACSFRADIGLPVVEISRRRRQQS